MGTEAGTRPLWAQATTTSTSEKWRAVSCLYHWLNLSLRKQCALRHRPRCRPPPHCSCWMKWVNNNNVKEMKRPNVKNCFIFSSSRRTARKGSAPGLSYSKIIVYYEMNMYIHTYINKYIQYMISTMYISSVKVNHIKSTRGRLQKIYYAHQKAWSWISQQTPSRQGWENFKVINDLQY